MSPLDEEALDKIARHHSGSASSYDDELEVRADEVVICPECGKVEDDPWEGIDSLEGYCPEWECGWCEAVFGLAWSRIVTFTSTRKEERR